jgi:hypothetical protein
MRMKNCNDTVWNRTRDLPACSAVPQPSAPPAACVNEIYKKIKHRHLQVESVPNRIHIKNLGYYLPLNRITWLRIGEDFWAFVETVSNVGVP